MKKYLYIFFWLIGSNCFIQSLNAQLGIRVALNYAYFSFNEDVEQKNDRKNMPNIGFEIGINTKVKVTNKFTFEPMLNLTKFGNIIDLGDGFEGHHSFYHLQLPLLIKYNISANKSALPSFFIGPNIGVGLGRPSFTFCTPSGCEDFTSSYSGNETYDYQLWNFGLIVGAQLNVYQNVHVDLRFLKNFTNLYNFTDVYKTNTFSLGVSYSYE